MSPIKPTFVNDPDPKGEAARISTHPDRLLGRLSRALRRRSISPGRLERLARVKAREFQELDPEAGVRLGEFIEWIDTQAESGSLAREDEQRAEEDVLPWLDGVLESYLAPTAQAARSEQARGKGHLARALASGFFDEQEIRTFLNGKGDGRTVEELLAQSLTQEEDGSQEAERDLGDALAGIAVEPESEVSRTCSYYIDSIEGDDDHPGTRERPFKTFWPIRCLFALIEIHALTGCSFSFLRIRVFLKGHSHFYFDADLADPPSRMPPFLATSEWSILASLHGDAPLILAAVYLKDKETDLSSEERTLWIEHYKSYGDPGEGHWFAGCFSPPCFLKVPKFLGALTIDAYEFHSSTRPTISGPWTYDRSAEGSWDNDNALLTRTMGAFNSPNGAVTWPIGIVFHDNVNVWLANVMMRGFFVGLRFWGVCQEVRVRRMAFNSMRRNGIQINLIENKDFLQWKVTQVQHARRMALAWFPVLFEDCPCDFEVDECLFMHIGLTTADSAFGLANCASNLEIHHSTFAACMDGVMSDQGGSGLHVHHNAFVALYEANPPGGDANAVDLKAVQPRTAEHLWQLYLDPVPVERWTSVHDNYILGSSCGGLIVHKGTGWLHIFNNYLIDNCFGFGLCPKAIAVVPVRGGFYEHLPRSRFPMLLNPYSVEIPEGWESPLDRREVTIAGRTCFSSRSIYLYRNVIAANWSHGMNIREGVVESAADVEAIAYGHSIVDLVIAHNTVDSNGGALLKRINENGYGDYDLCPDGYGICMTRQGRDAGITYLPFNDSELGDRYEKVAIYNNLLTNNFSLQLLIADESLSTFIMRNENAEPVLNLRGDEVVGIRSFRYYGLDFNGYFMRTDDPKERGHFTFEADHVDGRIRRGVTPVTVYTDAKFAVDSYRLPGLTDPYGPAGGPVASEIDLDFGRRHYNLAQDEFRTFHLELNGLALCLPLESYWDIYRRSPFLQEISSYRWATMIRTLYPGLSLALIYAEKADAGIEAWRPIPGSPVQEQGARTGPESFSSVGIDELRFPDDTEHAETAMQICDSPDIVGVRASGHPDMGAYKIPK